MSFDEYHLLDPDPDGSVVRTLRDIASTKPYRASRLITALEEFVWNGPSNGHRVEPEDSSGLVEIYLIPPRYILRMISDAAALVRVDHSVLEIEIILVRDEYGGPAEKAQWAEIKQIAMTALGLHQEQ